MTCSAPGARIGARGAIPMRDEVPIHGARILILDDTPRDAALLRNFLLIEGYRDVETLLDSRRALEVCAARGADLVLLDLRMPHLDGFQVMAQLGSQEATGGIPVIVVTADADRDNVVKALRQGAADYLRKPLEPAEVLIRIRNVLRTELLSRAVREQNAALERKVAERTRELEQTQEELFVRLLRATEFRDGGTGHHVRRIGRNVYRMALLAGLSDSKAKDYRYASMMHDIGKVSVPDSILLKPERLTAEEFEIMKRHTVDGAAILGGSDREVLRLAEEIALTHHERWDGTGYPLGLSGSDIPLGGRMTSIFDVYDALTSERPYKNPWTEEDALREIRRLSGRAFDPELVDLFLTNLSMFQRQEFDDPETAPAVRTLCARA